MKKVFLVLMAITMVLCLVACTNSKTKDDEPAKTIGDLYKKYEVLSEGYCGENFKCAYMDGKEVYLAYSTISDEKMEQIDALDFFSKTYTEDYHKIIYTLSIEKVESMESYRLSDKQISNYVGKTGQAMLDDDFRVSSYSTESNVVNLANKAFEYEVTFKDLVIGEEDVVEDLIKDCVITKIKYSNISNRITDED